MKAWKKIVVIGCFMSMLVQQYAHGQAALTPVENYVVNRAIGGIIANRIAIARGVAANDSAWLATAANDSVYKATMAGVSRTMTAANVASTVLGVGLAIAGAPVWLTIAASLGVLAVGAAFVAGNTKIEVVNTGSGNQFRVTQPATSVNALPYSSGQISIPSMQVGAQIYRDASCYASEVTCMLFPLLPTDVNFPYRWRPYPYDTAQWGKLWSVAYTFDQMKRSYLADLTGGDGVFDRSDDTYACYADSSLAGPCTLTRAVSWFIEPYWEFNSAGAPRLVGAWRSSFTATPDNPDDTRFPSTYGPATPTALGALVIDPSVQPIVKTDLDGVVAALSADAKAQKVSPQTLAQIVDTAWRNAAAQPDYQGLPYSASNPITAADVTTWTQANPGAVPTLDDMLRPATNPQTYPNGVPISPTITYASPATTPSGNQDGNVVGASNVNVVNTVKVDFGSDPGVADPTLEGTPTGAQILQPLTSLFPELRSFQAPQHVGTCPKPVFEVFGKSIVMDSQCTIAEQHRAALASVMLAVWMLVGLFILLSA